MAYTAIHAMEKIECAKAFPEYIKQHATINGTQIITLSESERLALPVHNSHMSGKLLGVAAVSTAPTVNANCLLAMQNPESPCHHCFSVKTMAQYNSLREWLENNALILSSRDLTDAEIDALCNAFRKDSKVGYVRIEPFGDAINATQCRNYLRIVRRGAEYGLYFGIWTKLPHIWNAVVNEMGKPSNCTMIYSAPSLGQTECPMPTMYWWLDCVFVVTRDLDATASALMAQGERVHYCKCAKGACADNSICGFCYRALARRDQNDAITWILEALR